MATITYKAGAGELVLPLREDMIVSMGRAALNTLSFAADTALSRYHADIMYDARRSRFVFRDLNSKNGSQVNGQALRDATVGLEGEERIVIGSTELRFSRVDRPAADDTQPLELAATAAAAHGVIAAPPAFAGGSGSLDKGAVIGNFEIIRLLGEGPNAKVYLANQTTMNRVVALKIIPSPSADAEEEFVMAVRAAGAMNHPGLIPCFDTGSFEEGLYLTMPLITNGNLDTAIAGGPFAEKTAVKHIIDVAAALDYALTTTGLTHGNLKCSNLLFDDDGSALVADMGLSGWLWKFHAPDTPWLQGAAPYVSPEVVIGVGSDWRSDLYSLGILFFKMLTGALPYWSNDEQELAMAHVQQAIPSLSASGASVSAGAQALLERMLAKDPAERFSSWRAFSEAADAVLHPVASAPAAQPPHPRAPIPLTNKIAPGRTGTQQPVRPLGRPVPQQPMRPGAQPIRPGTQQVRSPSANPFAKKPSTPFVKMSIKKK